MENNYLISIIIPAYNVEKFIEKAISSCINQSYKNIEIIVVDDGSTDNTSKLIDKMKDRDNRINVIHKKNEGVSIARNTGLQNAKGDYIIFLDADDYISYDYVEYMLYIVKKTNSDFCLSKNCFMSKDEEQEEDKIEVINSIEATILLLSPRVEVGCWNKIYKRSLLEDNNINFLQDLYFGEGLQFITNVAQHSKTVGVGQKKVYYYRKNNENSATTFFNIDKFRNGEKSLIYIKDHLICNDKNILKEWNTHYCSFCMNAILEILKHKKKKEYRGDYNSWTKKYRKYAFKVLMNDNITIKRKVKIILTVFFPNIIAKRDLRKRQELFKQSV